MQRFFFCENIIVPGWSHARSGHGYAPLTRRNTILKSKGALAAVCAGWLLLGGLDAEVYAAGKPAEADQILGYWQRGEGEAVIEVRRNAGGYHGVIVASERRPEIVGIKVFRQLRYDADTRTWRGRAYSIKRDREVRIDIEIPKANRLELTAHVMIFTRRVQFSRVEDAGFVSELAKR